MEIEEILYINLHLKKDFGTFNIALIITAAWSRCWTNKIWFDLIWIYSLLRRADARGSADTIYCMWRISLLCGPGIVNDVTKAGHAQNIN